jgi:hypothetical protein
MNRGILETIELSIIGNDEPVFRAPNAIKPIEAVPVKIDQSIDGRANNQKKQIKRRELRKNHG